VQLFKDEILDNLADGSNVAQFVSFGPALDLRFKRICGFENTHDTSFGDCISLLMLASGEKSVNVRSFLPHQPRSNEFIYGLTDVEEAIDHVRRLAAQGLYIIVNETIDVNDGGVSGVLQNDMIEFAPGAVPRFVETSEELVSTFPKELASEILQVVYGFDPQLTKYDKDIRLEFSIHPEKRGYKQERTIVWEKEQVDYVEVPHFLSWPTAFSRLIGDKAYGLMMADILGFAVPKTTVFPRKKSLEPFYFGTPTGASNNWMRTCPNVQVPGKYTTTRHWSNPYELMDSDDPSGKVLASCLSQHEVVAEFSGALLSDGEELTIEGTYGFGDEFMQGETEPALLPESIVNDLIRLYNNLEKVFGPVRLEWAHDGKKPWVLQLHTGVVKSSGRVVVPGEFEDSVSFDVKSGLENLRAIIKNIKPGFGIIVNGNVGMSSHIADMLRKAEVPSVLTSPNLTEGV